jgi:hypothetical protein
LRHPNPIMELPAKYMPLGFDYNNYHTCELRMIKPLMERDGYTNVRFTMGEMDSFGPLSRIVIADKDKKMVRFAYA